MTESWDAQKMADEVWERLGGKPGTWNNLIVTALQTALQAAFDAGYAAAMAEERPSIVTTDPHRKTYKFKSEAP